MSLKNKDNHNRWRNKTVAFRVSPEEDEQLEIAVKLTGLTKQDYITRRLLCKDVVVQGNPRVRIFVPTMQSADCTVDRKRKCHGFSQRRAAGCFRKQYAGRAVFAMWVPHANTAEASAEAAYLPSARRQPTALCSP